MSSAGLEAVELAESAGLILDDWQCWVLDEALAERRDGKWSAFEVALIVARQNGKGSVLEALELAALFLFEMRLIVHSAHEFKTAREHFLRMQTLIRNAPELAEQVAYIHTGAGAESIGLQSGARLNFVARSRGSGRGFTGDLVVLDEAFNLPEQSIGAMLPALAARPNPQVWYTSSAPHADSHVLHGVRNRALEGDAGRLFFAEWGNDPGVEPLDWEAVARANPGLGIRITAEHVESEYAAMGHLGDEFVRERLGVPSQEDRTAGVFPPGVWPALHDEGSTLDAPPTVALDVAHAMAFGSVAVAGARADGLTHVELIERHAGTGWIIDAAVGYAEKYGPIAVDAKGPVRALLEDLKAAGVPLRELTEQEFATGCALLQAKVLSGTARHIGQAPLDDAVAGAVIRPAGDSWRWTRSASQVDISPLCAVTVAVQASNAVAAPDFIY